jgi:hypothetical protein
VRSADFGGGVTWRDIGAIVPGAHGVEGAVPAGHDSLPLPERDLGRNERWVCEPALEFPLGRMPIGASADLSGARGNPPVNVGCGCREFTGTCDLNVFVTACVRIASSTWSQNECRGKSKNSGFSPIIDTRVRAEYVIEQSCFPARV